MLAGACTGGGDLDRRRRKGGDDGRSSRGLGDTDLTDDTYSCQYDLG